VSGGSGKIPPRARVLLAVLSDAREKTGHLRALIEQATVRKSGTFRVGGGSGSQDSNELRSLLARIGRLAHDINQLLAERGFAAMAEDVLEVANLARRGAGAPLATLHRMREVVGQIYTDFDQTERKVMEQEERPPEPSPQ
jgi:hypothetical protein